MEATSTNVSTIYGKHRQSGANQRVGVQVYIPRNTTVLAIQYIVNAGVLKAFKLKSPPGTFFGGNRRARTIFEMPSVNIRMKPKMRIVHGKLKKINTLAKLMLVVLVPLPNDSDELASYNRKKNPPNGGPSRHNPCCDTPSFFEPMTNHTPCRSEAHSTS